MSTTITIEAADEITVVETSEAPATTIEIAGSVISGGGGGTWGSISGTLADQLDLQAALDDKVNIVVGKQLSTEDYTTAEKTKLSGIATGATANDTDANLKNRANHTGTQLASTISDFQAQVSANSDVAAMKAIIGDGVTDGDTVVDTLSEMLATFQTYTEGVDIATLINTKVDKVTGKGLSTEDYTTAEKTKLAGIATGATANSSDATLLARANHTGTQSADTITDGTTNKAYTATEKTKLAGIATGATANSSDATLLARANHTGTQLAATISDFNSAALAAAPAETVTTEGALISGATSKATPVDADSIGLSDSAASNVLKKLTWANLKATVKTYFDTLYATISHTHTAANITDFNSAALSAAPAETTTTQGALINGATAKTTPVDADYVGLMDSAASNILKKLSWANIKATAKTYFDTLYANISHTHPQSDITNLTTDLAAKANKLKRIGRLASGSSGSALTNIGHTAITAAGTATGRTIASTNLMTATRRVGYVSASSAGSVAGFRVPSQHMWRGNAAGMGGFDCWITFGISATATGYLFYVGLQTSTSQPGATTLPSAYTDIIGVGFEQGTDTNFQILHNDSAGAATKVDTGIPPDTTKFYRLRIIAASNAGAVSVTLTDLSNGGTEFTTSPGSNLPAGATFLTEVLHISNNATAATVTAEIGEVYVETD